MSLDSVKQLQSLNSLMKKQLDAYPAETAMILGVAGGNGLEHISTDKYNTVYVVTALFQTGKRKARLYG